MECKKCGDCCRKEGYVWWNMWDFINLADAFGMDMDDMILYLNMDVIFDDTENDVIVQTQKGACPFLSDNNTCGVYSHRATYCKQYKCWEEEI